MPLLPVSILFASRGQKNRSCLFLQHIISDFPLNILVQLGPLNSLTIATRVHHLLDILGL